MAENIEDVDALIEMVRGQMQDVNTSIEGVIVSYANGRASVKPVGQKRFADGDSLEYPVIQNVRVQWPQFNGGQCGIKGPVKPGDKCYLFFAQQASDGSDDIRRFNMSDCYAMVTGNGQVAAGGSNNDDMIMWFGGAHIRLTAAGELVINAPGGVKIETPDMTSSGNFTNEGYMTGNTGLAITGTHPQTGRVSRFGGSIYVEGGDVIADTISLKTHVHSGVQSGGSNTGQPV